MMCAIGFVDIDDSTIIQKKKKQVMEQLIFKTNQDFKQVTFDHETESWTFMFKTDYVSSSGLWRILKHKKIEHVSLDNGQQFGLPNPINLEKEINELLKDKKLETIIIKKDTSDLQLILTDNLEIEIFISSSGYETYDFSFDSKRYVGKGSGAIAIL